MQINEIALRLGMVELSLIETQEKNESVIDPTIIALREARKILISLELKKMANEMEDGPNE